MSYGLYGKAKRCMMAKQAISTHSRTLGIPIFTSIYETLGPVVMTGFVPDERKEIRSY